MASIAPRRMTDDASRKDGVRGSTAFITEQDIQAAKDRLRPLLSTQFRREFFGRERLAKLERVVDGTIGPEFLLDLIVRQKGPQLLADKPRRVGQRNTSIRRVLLEDLSDEALRALYRSVCRIDEMPSQRGRIESTLEDFNWHRGGPSALRITRALGLPDAFAGVKEANKRSPSYIIDPIGQVPVLKPFQRGLLREATKALEKRKRAMVSSFTGTGKTRMGMEIAIDYLESEEECPAVLWVAQKGVLLEQACDAIDQLWPWKGLECGESLQVFRFWEEQQFNDLLPEGPCLVIATAQKILARLGKSDPFLEAVLSRARLLVVDEAHHALAKGHQTIIHAYENARDKRRSRVLGLTATPGRSNLIDEHESEKLAALFGRTLIVPDVASHGTSLRWFQNEGYLSQLDHLEVRTDSQIPQTLGKRGGMIEEDQSGYKDYTTEFLEVVGEDSLRNRGILRELARLNSEGRRSLVFCCNIVQAEILFQSTAVQGIMAGIIHHKIDPRDRRHTINQFRRGEIQTLFNVEVLTTGFDAPKVDTIVMCRPTLSRVLYEQMIGRGMRGPQMGGTRRCEVVDFTTNFGHFNEPQAWEAFWREWNLPQPGAGPASPLGWEVIRAEPEDEEQPKA